jgi:hypothetical protein
MEQGMRLRSDRDGALFHAVATPRGRGYDGFMAYHLTTRSVEKLVKKYASRSAPTRPW